MERLPNLGSLRSIANYGEDEVDSDDENMTRKKMKVSVEEETKEDASDLDIVLSDEEGDSSRPSSTENKVTVSQPRVNIASRLVSYGGDEDEDEEAKIKVKEVQDPAESEAAGTLHTEQSPIGSEESNPDKSPTEEIKSFPSAPKEETSEDAIPKELRDHLAAVKSIHVTLPEEPDGRCSNSLQEKIEKLLETKLRTGRDLKDTIQRRKNFRNPSIYEKLVSFCSINETGTNYPPHIYDPFSWTEESFYENLSKLQKEHHEKKQKERSKVEFVSATKKSVSAADEAAKKRKSKWDVTSSGTAAPVASSTIPATALHTIASVQAAVAAKAKVINTIATIPAKKS